jgi:hypothetical protein
MATDKDFKVKNGLQVDTDTLVVDATNDRVGINNSSPSYPLDVNGITATDVLNAQGGNYTASIDSTTIAGVVLKQGNKLFSESTSGQYLRNIFQHETSNGHFIFGQTGTSLIGDMKFYAGSSGNFFFATGGSDTTGLQVGTSTTISYQPIRINSGGLQIGTTEVITSARNLTNIGTISSGAITADSTGTNTVTIDGTGSYTLRSYHDGGGVGWATGSGTSWNNLLYLDDSNDFVRIYSGQAERARFNSSGIDARSGGFRINGTTVIDSSRNLTNIGTINSGAITSSGQVYADELRVTNDALFEGSIDAGNNTIASGAIESSASVTANTFMQIVGASGSSGFMYIYDRDNGTSNTDGFLLQKSGNNAFVYNRESSGSLSLGAGDTSNYLVIDSSGNIDLGSTQILDQSRNLTNIGTISSGALTVTADAGNEQITIKRSSNTNEQLILGFHSSDYATIQAVEQNVAFRPLVLQPSGANVGIGTTSPTQKVAVGTSASETIGYGIDWTGGGAGQVASFTANTSTGEVRIGATNSAGTYFPTFYSNGSEAMRIDSSGNTTVRSGNKLIVNRTDNAIGGEISYEAGSGWKINDANGDGTRFFTGSTERARFDGSGRLGIGTTSPSALLHVNGSGSWIRHTGYGQILDMGNWTDGLVRIESTGAPMYIKAAGSNHMAFDTNSNERMRIDSSGNVGIGTTSPDSKLHVNQTAANYAAHFESANANSYGVWIEAGASANNGYPLLSVTDNGGSNQYFRVDSGTGNVGIGTGSPDLKLHIAHSDSNNGLLLEHTAQASGHQYLLNARQSEGLIFQRWTNGSFSSNTMTLDYNNRVGIGTTTPATKLEISDATSPVLKFLRPSVQAWRIGINGSDFRIDPQSDTLASPSLTINSAGNMGLGTASPSTNLHLVASSPQIRLQHSGNSFFSRIITDSGNNLILGTGSNGTERMRITSAGTIDASGVIDGVGGSNSAPSYIFEGDTNTGLYHPAVDTIAFATGGSERGRFSSTGLSVVGNTAISGNFNTSLGGYQVGGTDVITSSRNLVNIDSLTFTGTSGTTVSIPSHSGFEIDITGSTAGNIRANVDLYLLSQTGKLHLGANGTNSRLVVNESGLVGIGTTNPLMKLHVNTSGTSGLTGVANRGMIITDSIGARLVLEDTGATSNRKNFMLRSESDVFTISGLNDDGSAFTTENMLVITGSSGDVGIGKVNPAQKLDVQGNIGVGGTEVINSSRAIVNTASVSSNGTIGNMTAGSLGQQMEKGDASVTTLRFDANRWRLYAGANAGEVLTVAEGGNVGINRNFPNDKLDINGSMRISGAYKIGANKVIEQVGTRLNIGDVNNNDYIVDITAYGDTSSIVMNDGFIDVVGDFDIAGALSKNSGSFKIDHPLKPDTHHLVHSFVEGPQADNLYRGVIDLHNGRATIDLDDWFGMTPGTFLALNRDIQAFVNNSDTWDNVRAKVMGSQLVIECQNPESNAKVSWLVIGERQDKEIHESSLTDDHGKVIVEPQKVG